MTEKKPTGECPTHGMVTGDDVNMRFPEPATCDKCGSELTVARLI